MTESTTSPQVSVVMGVFNAQQTLEKTVASVLAQEGLSLELIIVDDGSTDATPAILGRRAHDDSRVKVLHQPHAGLTSALVRGCAAARAPLIARQDAGDVSLAGRLRRQAQLFAQHPQSAFVSCATEYVDSDGAFLFRSAGQSRAVKPIDVIDADEAHGMLDGPSHHGSVMFRRDAYELAGGYRTEFYFGQDWDLWYRLAERGQFCLIPDTLYRARIAPGDISTTRKFDQERLAALSLRAMRERAAGRSEEPILAEAARIRPLPTAPEPREVRRAAAHASYFIGECLRRNGEFERAARHFREAVAREPWLAKAWLRLAQAKLGHARPDR